MFCQSKYSISSLLSTHSRGEVLYMPNLVTMYWKYFQNEVYDIIQIDTMIITA